MVQGTFGDRSAIILCTVEATEAQRTARRKISSLILSEVPRDEHITVLDSRFKIPLPEHSVASLSKAEN